ncbi:phosphate ABC transporter permease PstA [Bartonella sp. DGB1]|uniref:phosphate ABC transporter permease PstA n=1 Tax=Bartonella sp. DGB1 TaxID=3239807 RepID=UPI003523B5DE
MNQSSTQVSVKRDIGLKKRYAAERRFRLYGLFSIFIGILFLFILLCSIVSKGYSAFTQTTINVPVYFDKNIIDPKNELANNPQVLQLADYNLLARIALAKQLDVDLKDRRAMLEIGRMISTDARSKLQSMLMDNPDLIGKQVNVKFLASSNIDAAYKGHIDTTIDEKNRVVTDRQLAWLNLLADKKIIFKRFNFNLFINGASSRPELAGLGVALLGSFYMIMIVLLISLPIGVATSIYLEEYARKNKFIDLIEVNINNLSAVPSIVFGLLGLAVFINFFGLPRSSSLVGGLVLSLMTLPTIIIATRSALRMVPNSIRSAALGIGASKNQMVFHHVLPLALPGILTGTIIGLARALGETAPLLLIGMVAFVKDYPLSPMDPTTSLSVQIYMWAGNAERAFIERTSAAIMVLLFLLIIMNLLAIFLRRRFERRW